MGIQYQINLKAYHTFGFQSIAERFVNLISHKQIVEMVHDGVFAQWPFFVLGGGSNVLFKTKVGGLVVHPSMVGVQVVENNRDYVLVDAMAGVEWDALVAFCVENGFHGLENLSWIPGNVGASPVQNIGAYGVEVCQAIDSVYAVDLMDGRSLVLSADECAFGYRDSIFKNELKNRTLITKVRFKLKLKADFNLGYGQVAHAVDALGGATLHNVRKAIVEIRRSKLPDPSEFGNAGSFFKNPVVAKAFAERIKQENPLMPEYLVDDHHVKVPAGWLIEQCGWKGKSMGQASVHPNQALVLVNLGSATCEEVLALADAIVADVESRFGIRLEKEVNVVG